jgi:AcrR family transcriptional regulator
MADEVGRMSVEATEASALAGLPVGLRERRRAELSSAITDAALDLFEERGVDNTTIADIAAAVGISTRTFFRYFPSKELAALSGQHAFDDATAGLLDDVRADQPVLRQLIDAFRAVTTQLDDESGGTKRQLVRVRRLLLAHPGMRAASLHVEEDGNILLAGMINDAVPLEGGLQEARLIVNAATYSLRLAFDEWVRNEQDVDAPSLPEVYDRVLSIMGRVYSPPVVLSQES